MQWSCVNSSWIILCLLLILQREVALSSMNIGPISGMIAPLSGNSLGLQRAQVTHGIREVSLQCHSHPCARSEETLCVFIYIISIYSSPCAKTLEAKLGCESGLWTRESLCVLSPRGLPRHWLVCASGTRFSK